MADNWKRNQIIAEAARRIISQADPAIVAMGHANRNRALLELRRQLARETGCSLDTAARHIGLRSLTK